MRLISFLFIVLFYVSCSENSTKHFQNYFDTKKFFISTIEKFKKGNYTLSKDMSFNSKQSHVEIKNVEWEKELSMFANIDLLKPAYRDKFHVDSTRQDSSSYTLKYTSVDSKTDIKKLEITSDFFKKIPKKIVIQLSEKNNLYTSETELEYFADSAYSISGKQKTRLLESSSYLVKGQIFIN